MVAHDNTGGKTFTVVSNKPFPWLQVGLLGMLLLNESLASMMLLPFVGLFVAHLLKISPDEAGYASGFLVGVFQLALMLSGKWWGNFSDTHGRKPALLLGVILSAIAMIFFGLSPNIYVALLWRFVHGLTNGISAVAKSAMAEVAGPVDETKGFATISLAWGIGSLVGPAVGGFLYDPTKKPHLGLGKTAILQDYPVLLPALVIAVYSAGISVLAMLVLEESNPSDVPITIYSFVPLPVADFINWMFGGKMLEWDAYSEDNTEEGGGGSMMTAIMDHRQFGGGESMGGGGEEGIAAQSSDGLVRRGGGTGGRVHHSTVTIYTPASESKDQSDYRYSEEPIYRKKQHSSSTQELSRLGDSINAGSINHHLNSSTSIHNVAPGSPATAVAAATAAGHASRRLLSHSNRTSVPGTTFQSLCIPATQLVAKPITDIAKQLTFSEAFINPNTRAAILIYMCVAFAEIGFQETFPLWGVASVRSGGLGLSSSEVGSIVVLVSVPCIISNLAYPKVAERVGTPNPLFGVCAWVWAFSQIALPYATLFEATMGYQYVVLMVSVWQVSSAWAFSVSYALIARAAPPGNLGTMNGYSQSMGAAMRTVCPMLLGPVFAWSVGHPHVFPFNHHFAFIVSAVPLFFTVKLIIHFNKWKR